MPDLMEPIALPEAALVADRFSGCAELENLMVVPTPEPEQTQSRSSSRRGLRVSALLARLSRLLLV